MGGLHIEGGLDRVGDAGQGEVIDVADTLTEPGSVEPSEVANVGPSVASYRDGEDVVWISLLKFHAQRPRPW